MASVRRVLSAGFVLDDDPDRIDREAVHVVLSGADWAKGRDWSVTDDLIATGGARGRALSPER